MTEKSQSKVDDYCFILRGDVSKLEASLIPNKKHHMANMDPIQASSSATGPTKATSANKRLDSNHRILLMRCVACELEYVQDVPSILTFDRRYLQKVAHFIQSIFWYFKR